MVKSTPPARPEVAQRAEVVVQDLHQHQPDGRGQHEPEDRQPFAQQVSVVGVQPRRSYPARARKQNPNRPPAGAAAPNRWVEKAPRHPFASAALQPPSCFFMTNALSPLLLPVFAAAVAGSALA